LKNISTGSFSLQSILEKRGIPLYENGKIRNAIDILEDLFLLNPKKLTGLFYEIGEEEDFANNVFQVARYIELVREEKNES
jgi:hypothetical protein